MTDWPSVTAEKIESVRSTFDELIFSRGAALASYARVEQQVVHVAQCAIGCDYRIAYSIIHRIVQTRTRYSVIEDALSVSRPELVAAWKRLVKWLSDVDGRRNQIVHWAPGVDIIVVSVGDKSDAFEHPKLRSHFDHASQIADIDIYQFVSDADLLADLINRFWLPFVDSSYEAWHDIYRELPVHQQPSALLQCLSDAIPLDLQRASQG